MTSIVALRVFPLFDGCQIFETLEIGKCLLCSKAPEILLRIVEDIRAHRSSLLQCMRRVELHNNTFRHETSLEIPFRRSHWSSSPVCCPLIHPQKIRPRDEPDEIEPLETVEHDTGFFCQLLKKQGKGKREGSRVEREVRDKSNIE